MRKNDLSSSWENFSKNKSLENRQKLVHAVAAYIFTNLTYITSQACSLKDDTRSDFILWIYPKLAKIVEKFNPERSSLPTYIGMIVKFKYKTFCREQKKHYYIQEAAEIEGNSLTEKSFNEENTDCFSSPADSVSEFAAEYNTPSKPLIPSGALAFTKCMKKKKARDILLLALKSTFYISEDLVEKSAAACGISKNELKALMDTIRTDYGERQKLFESLKMQRHGYYLRSFICQQRLRKLASEYNQDICEAKPIEKEKEFCERQKERLSVRMSKIQRTPSNRYLASLLNIPRGSVDSALVRLKKELYPEKPWNFTSQAETDINSRK